MPINSFTAELLEGLADLGEGGLKFLILSPRKFAHYAYQKLGNRQIPPRQFQETLSRLKKRGYFVAGANAIELSPKGQAALSNYRLDQHRLKTDQPWDGIWRVIVWDIPERNRSLRDRVRNTLKRLNFVRIQQSIWVTPYPCWKEIAGFRKYLKIESGLIYLEAAMIEDEESLMTHFKIERKAISAYTHGREYMTVK